MKQIKIALLLTLFLSGCGVDKDNTDLLNTNSLKAQKVSDKAILSGDSFTLDNTKEAFSHFSPKLSFQERTKFFVGQSFFDQSWIVAPSSTVARDGLGPFFNARSCASCHFKDGRGKPPKEGELLESMLLRVSVKDKDNNFVPSHIYGDQIQGFGINNLKGEADIGVEYTDIKGSYNDGEKYILKKPIYKITKLNYGNNEGELFISPRVSPQMIGMGLLEDIPENDIISFSDPDDKDKNGISGRPNYVWDIEKNEFSLGRFGWKSNQPTVKQQVAGAFSGDMGITSSMFPKEGFSTIQEEFFKDKNIVSGGEPEINDKNLDSVILYSKNLAVPVRRNISDPKVTEGERIFKELNCNSCHRTDIKSGNQIIHPYTDLLLHDMGDDLSDNRPDFLAEGNEWRTPPLWGIGLFKTVNNHTNYLHDGRANNLTEAVLWHGGEAEKSKNDFKALNKNQRDALIKFLESL